MGTQMGSNFDLDLIILDEGTTLSGVWRYSTDLFDEETIARMASHFVRILESAVDAPATRLVDLPLTSPAERERLLHAWNAPGAPRTPVYRIVGRSVRGAGGANARRQRGVV